MIRLPLETDKKLDECLVRIAKQVAEVEDKLTEEQIAQAIKQACLCGDFQKLVLPCGTYHIDGVLKFGISQSVVYLPYEAYNEEHSKFERYKEAVNSILNVEQQQLLAQKLHEIQDIQDA